jgi:hypothetical protein
LSWAGGAEYVQPISAVVPGAHGRILDVLVETTAELSIRTIPVWHVVAPVGDRGSPRLVVFVEHCQGDPKAVERLCSHHHVG